MTYAVLVTMWLGAVLRAQALGILIPAYFDPASQSTNWDSMARAAERVPLAAIMNPNNGPSTAVRPAYVQAITKLRTSGGRVIGYVYSSYTVRPIAQVKADIDRYESFYDIDGFFVDEMTNNNVAANLTYYEELYRYIKSKKPSYWIVGNPGINTLEIYLTRPAADTLVTFESNTGYINYRPDPWTQTRPATAFSHLCYAVATAETMTNYVQLARARNAAYIYVTDDSGSNPWDRLPTYWSAEVELIEQINRQAASNKPSALSISVTGDKFAEITVTGTPGRYVVQGSTNLQKCQPVVTNVSAEGRFTVTEPGLTNSTNRAYRAEQ